MVRIVTIEIIVTIVVTAAMAFPFYDTNNKSNPEGIALIIFISIIKLII